MKPFCVIRAISGSDWRLIVRFTIVRPNASFGWLGGRRNLPYLSKSFFFQAPGTSPCSFTWNKISHLRPGKCLVVDRTFCYGCACHSGGVLLRSPRLWSETVHPFYSRLRSDISGLRLPHFWLTLKNIFFVIFRSFVPNLQCCKSLQELRVNRPTSEIGFIARHSAHDASPTSNQWSPSPRSTDFHPT